MKHITILIVALLVLTSCAKMSVYKSKGISYFEKPQQEIESLVQFPLPPVGEHPMLISFKPVVAEDAIYFPIDTRYKSGSEFISYSTIYALDPQSLAKKDSLVIKEDGKSCKFRNIILGKDILIVGVKDSICTIYRTDKNLKILNEYNTGIKAFNLFYAAIFDGKLRLVLNDNTKTAYMYDLDENMQPFRQRFLIKNTYKYEVHNNDLWFYEAGDNSISTIRYNLSVLDPTPVINAYNVAIPQDSNGTKNFTFVVGDSVIYISYSRVKPEGGYKANLYSVNIANKTIQSREFEGTFGFDILERRGKTYLYYSKQYGKLGDKQAVAISEIAPDLTEKSQNLNFYLSPLINTVKDIVTLNDTKVILTGYYLVKNGKKEKMDMPGISQKLWDDFDTPNFMAIYDLK